MRKRFAGLTIIAIAPAIVEIVNAVRFALKDDITLSFEIGMAAAVQTAMVQIPALVGRAVPCILYLCISPMCEC